MNIQQTHNMDNQVVLITGAARRVGAGIARHLHRCGARLVLHYRGSQQEAYALAEQLNQVRHGSVALVQADLLESDRLPQLMAEAVACFGRLDGLVNNASSFFPTPIGEMSGAEWQDLMGSNVQAPLFLSQAAVPYLRATQGAIVGIVDIHAERPMKGHVLYNIAKAGHAQLIRSLALELAPQIRVNGVSPGTNVWPEDDHVFTPAVRSAITASIPLARIGNPDDIAHAVAFLLSDAASYMTGQILAVDGGRSLVM